MPFIALGGGMLMGLPYSVLMPLMPETEHGVPTGLYSLSRGLGVMADPILAGVATHLGDALVSSTEGYAAIWLVAAAASLLSIPPVRSTRGHEEDRRQLADR